MSEHEIFNSDDEDVLDNDKNYSYKKEKLNFFKSLFTLNFLPYFLSVVGLMFGFLGKVIFAFTLSNIVSGIFFIFAFGSALGGFVIGLINLIKDKKEKFTIQLIVCAIALGIIAIML